MQLTIDDSTMKLLFPNEHVFKPNTTSKKRRLKRILNIRIFFTIDRHTVVFLACLSLITKCRNHQKSKEKGLNRPFIYDTKILYQRPLCVRP